MKMLPLLYESKNVTRKCHTTVWRISQLQKPRRDFLWKSVSRDGPRERPGMQPSRAKLAKAGLAEWGAQQSWGRV